jgi:sarcosine oxidase gamma subunit
MTAARADIDRSIEATAAALAKLTPAQFDQVLVDAHHTLLEFIEDEWLAMTPDEESRAAARRAASERFHASVRVHDFSQWRAA